MTRLLALSFCFIFSVFIAPSVSWGDDSVLHITSRKNTYEFNIELAITPEERARGLMYREELPENSGMLFYFDTDMMLGFWMKNTLIPLDMIFIRNDGTISSIHKNAIPHDLTSIQSKEKVIAVFEINGGTADKLGIKPEDKIHHSLFSNAIAE